MSREQSLVLLASAGTGKTFQLTNRLLALFARGVGPERVLASTFTRKAAGEILERLMLRLCAAAASEQAAAELASQIGVGLDRARVQSLAAELLRAVDRLRISTLDAWFKERVQASAFEFGLPADWDVADPELERRLCGRALSRALDRPRTESEWSTLISDLSRGGAESRVHAGLLAGLSQAARFARECSSEAWEFPALPADAAEADVQQATEVLARAAVPLTKAGTPRKNFGTALARLRASVAAGSWQEFAKDSLTAKVIGGEDRFDSTTIPPELVQAIQVLLKRAAHRLARLVRNQNRALRALVADYLEELDLATREERRISFDALPRLLAARASSGNGGDGGELPQHLLLDEFQDTSSLQWRALEPGVRAILERAGQSFFCVGDVKQSIYAWRDGNPRLLAELSDRLSVPKQTLALNRRSAKTVLDFVNLVFENIDSNAALCDPEAHAAALQFRQGFEAHLPHGDRTGSVRIYACGTVENRVLSKPREGLRLARGVAAAAQIRAERPHWSIAFLVRSKKLVPELLELLAREGIAASGEGGNPLTDSAAVNAALSLLEFADHPADDFAYFHVATSPLAREALVGFPASPEQRRRAALSLRERWLALTPAEFLARLRPAVFEHYGPFDRRRFDQLLALALRIDAPQRLRPASFAERLAAERVVDPASSAVRVLTVHGSKGLEFDAVILLDLDGSLSRNERGVIAHRRDGDPRAPYDVVTHTLDNHSRALLPDLEEVHGAARTARLQEELCVLYVALTRAVRHLEIVVDHPGDNLARATFAGILLHATGVARVEPGSFVGVEPGPPPGLAEESASTSRAAESSKPAAPRAPRGIRLGGGVATAVPLAPSRQAARSGGQRRPTADLFQPAALARRRGILWHVWFESLAWSDGPRPSVEELLDAARRGGIFDAAPAEAREWLAALDQPGVASELSRVEAARRLGADPGELLLLRERRFAYRVDSARGRETVQGAFDRAVVSRARGRAEVLDFKSESLPGASQELCLERALLYRPQMDLYRSAVARLHGLAEESVALRLCFAAVGRTVELP
ncbi:MAG: UvrD-helicase domain-containing protein [Planctomycetes bacterium]|nr:UvrD-helicase domain-containing protein [Planctomycetota bacterium]